MNVFFNLIPSKFETTVLKPHSWRINGLDGETKAAKTMEVCVHPFGFLRKGGKVWKQLVGDHSKILENIDLAWEVEHEKKFSHPTVQTVLV